MKNGIDFIYEYSDLNLFHTRVQILTGKYAGIILEFGGSVLMQIGEKNTFNFDYILYEIPDQFHSPRLRTDGEFNNFLGYLLVDIVDCRNKDPLEKEKLFKAASEQSNCNIKISDKWYPSKEMCLPQPITTLGSF